MYMHVILHLSKYLFYFTTLHFQGLKKIPRYFPISLSPARMNVLLNVHWIFQGLHVFIYEDILEFTIRVTVTSKQNTGNPHSISTALIGMRNLGLRTLNKCEQYSALCSIAFLRFQPFLNWLIKRMRWSSENTIGMKIGLIAFCCLLLLNMVAEHLLRKFQPLYSTTPVYVY